MGVLAAVIAFVIVMVFFQRSNNAYKQEQQRIEQNLAKGEAAVLESQKLKRPNPIEFNYFDGHSGDTTDFHGKPTVLNFWSSTCPPCIAEMPAFEKVNNQLHTQVDFYGINVSDEREAADELVAQTGVSYTLIEDPESKIFKAYEGYLMPTTVFLDANGNPKHVQIGALDETSLTELINTYLLDD